MRRALVRGNAFSRYEQFETSPDTIEQELRSADCEQRPILGQLYYRCHVITTSDVNWQTSSTHQSETCPYPQGLQLCSVSPVSKTLACGQFSS